ncbi:MAG: HAMP domain-containing protein [Planctomycetaceae bacterium]|nr:HAMP domain-containing protein [Planctomycetaceae bacterium]MBT6157597.1 HAMP domain-containing protein [Planctomycetaceae bacterium]MBT6486187.1 HAMP domain-containing protein [Planctomycetaceae bacterium]MBT6497860.1 HAMP domain-containing protein [Planctomycetaceae bacterium]
MLFTRTIRRKMVFGLSLVLVMLVTLSLSAISGLLSYRETVRGLTLKIDRVPRRSDLTAAFGLLYDPLLRTAPQYRGQEFKRQMKTVEREVQIFTGKLDDLPPAPGVRDQRPITYQLLAQVGLRLEKLKEIGADLNDEKQVAATTERMLRELGYLQLLAHRMPDSQLGLKQTLLAARSAYHTRFVWVGGTSALVAILFFSLVSYGYTGIFSPLSRLHQGASRVAQGDFDYRLDLQTNDEMAELAESFNRMTDRFQQTNCDLDRQVRERTKQLLRSERLAGIGLLAAGVGHEINNPLSAIAMATESIQYRWQELCADADPAEVENVKEYLEMIHSEAFRCREITARLLDFARGDDGVRSSNNLTQIISDVLLMVRPMSQFQDRHIEFSHTEACMAEVNASEIKQVVLNLVANSLEAMQSGGTLNIDVTEQVDHAILTFQDDGCGMTPEVIENIFEPFFTRRQDGRGTGLGMAISHRIISDHGGTVEVTSDGPGCGSTFRLHIPRSVPHSQAAA